MDPEISGVICTWNRRASLEGSLGGLLRQSLARERYEILLVDNGSTDGTREWALERAAGARNFRYLYEGRVCKSHAANLGWQAARGSVVAYLDDDTLPDPAWLERLLERFQAHDRSLGAVGGRVVPAWEAPPPEWLEPRLLEYLSLLDLAAEDIELGPGQSLVGANMAFRRQVLAELDGFDPRLDRRGALLLSGGETLLERRLEAAGYRRLYTPAALVQHVIPTERMNRDWFRRRFYWAGVSAVFMDEILKPPPETFRHRAGLLAWCCRRTIAMAWHALRRRPQGFVEELERWRRRGVLAGQWRLVLGRTE